MIVVDTNVIAYLWLPGPYTAAAERVWRTDSDWRAPLLWRSEFRNVLVGCLRRRRLSLDTAVRIVVEAEAQLGGKEYAVPSREVIQRAAGSRCSAYDCEFVVLADDLGVPLVTSDAQVLESFPRIARPLATYAP